MKKGFTLIELLIAISILAILLSLSYAGLNSVLKNHALLSVQQEQFKQFNQSFTRLRTELHRIIPRPVRDAYNNQQAALSLAPQFMRFTILGRPNPTHLPRSSLQRIEYFLEDTQFKKRTWLAIDGTDMNHYREEILLDNIQQLQFSALSDKQQWQNLWPPEAIENTNQLTLLPRAIKITLTQEDKDDFIQLIELPR